MEFAAIAQKEIIAAHVLVAVESRNPDPEGFRVEVKRNTGFLSVSVAPLSFSSVVVQEK